LLTKGGISNIIYEAAELLHYYLPIIRQPSCLVAISQSGESAEIVHLLEALGKRVPTLGIFNSEESYLAISCDLGLPLLAGPQRACGTKTNIATIAVMLLLAEATLSPEHRVTGTPILKLIGSIEHLSLNWRQRFNPAADFLEGASVYNFLGRGPGLISAKFSAVLFREVTKNVAEGMSSAAFRHGILEAVRKEHRVIVFAPQGATYDLSIGFTRQLLEYKVNVMLVTNRKTDIKPNDNLFVLETDRFDEFWAPVMDLVPFQFIGHILAERQGLVPGELTLASYVTRVE
jgi:glucosamine--fructose-6-phosphate aminotransferase (isomerizing)